MLKLSTSPSVLKKWTAPASADNKSAKQRLSFLALALGLLAAGDVAAQTSYVTVPATFNSRSNNMRGPMTSANSATGTTTYQRSAALYRASEMNGLTSGMEFESIGFNVDTAATSPVSGNMKIYLVNTSDNTFSRALNWSALISTPTAMTLVYDGAFTIPASTGFYDIDFTTNFNYTGGGVYMAFEWQTSDLDPVPAWYLTNNTLAGGVASGASDAAFPSTLAASSFRPFVRFGFTPEANDLSVRAIHALGKVPDLNATLPTPVRATVVNNGTNDLNNITLTLDASGANTYNTTANIASIASGDTALVEFTGFTPTNLGATTLTVTAPADDQSANNTATWTMTVTDSTISHLPVGTQPTSGVGYGTGSGLLLNRYEVQNSQMVYVPRVRVQIANNNSVIGKTVFGVVVDANGDILGRSEDKTIASGDLGTMFTFQINDPAPATVEDEVFYVGLAQVASATAYHPVATASEPFPTPGAYYIAGGAAALNGGVMPTENNTLGRFIMEADLVTTLVSAPEAMVAEKMSVYPNPNNGEFNISFGEFVTERANVVIVDVTGKTVYSNVIEVNGTTANVKTTGLTAGVYMMQVTTTSNVITKQVVIK